EDMVAMVRGVVEAGLEPHEVGAWAAWSVGKLGRIDAEILEAQAELRRWRRGVREAATDLATVNTRVAKLAEVIERAKVEPGLARLLAQADSERGREVVAQVLRVAEEVRAARRRASPASVGCPE